MGFVKSFEEIAKMDLETADFYDAEACGVFWETKPEIVERLLPPPLEPIERPIAYAYIANFPKTNFGVSYLEAALFLMTQFKGEMGIYCLSMPVTNDIAMAAGREFYGYPKKLAEISFERTEKEVNGWAQRRGTRFLELHAKMTDTFNDDDAGEILDEIDIFNPVFVTYNYKHFPAPEGGAYDYNPRLVREEVELRPNSMEIGEAEIVLRSSEYEPWGEVEVVRILGAVYTTGNNSMRKGKVVAEVNPLEFLPYSYLKWDPY